MICRSKAIMASDNKLLRTLNYTFLYFMLVPILESEINEECVSFTKMFSFVLL